MLRVWHKTGRRFLVAIATLEAIEFFFLRESFAENKMSSTIDQSKICFQVDAVEISGRIYYL